MDEKVRITSQLILAICTCNSYNKIEKRLLLFAVNNLYYLNDFETYEELVDAVGQFIHYYNYQRRQHRLNCLAPMDYRSLLEAA